MIIWKAVISQSESESETTKSTVSGVYYSKGIYCTFYFLHVPGDSEPLNSELTDASALLLEEGQDLYSVVFDGIIDDFPIYHTNNQVDIAISAHTEDNPFFPDPMPSSPLSPSDDWLVFYEDGNFKGLELRAGNSSIGIPQFDHRLNRDKNFPSHYNKCEIFSFQNDHKISNFTRFRWSYFGNKMNDRISSWSFRLCRSRSGGTHISGTQVNEDCECKNFPF